MARQCHDDLPQTKPWHREEGAQSHDIVMEQQPATS